MNVLIVEDEKNLGLTLSEYLTDLHYNTLWCQTFKETLSKIKHFNPEVIFMDIILPDGSGIELAKQINLPRTKIIFLSALNDPQTRLESLEAGGYQYISKPYSLKELKIRLKRIENSIPHKVNFKDLTIDFDQYLVTKSSGSAIHKHNKSSKLSTKEKEILDLLLSHINQVVSRDTIIGQIWGADHYPSNRTVDNYIVNIRKIFEKLSDQKIKIESIRGIGYKLVD